MNLAEIDRRDKKIDSILELINSELAELILPQVIDIFKIERKVKLFKDISLFFKRKVESKLVDEITDYAFSIYDENNKKSNLAIKDKIKNLGNISSYNFTVPDVEAYNFINLSKEGIKINTQDKVEQMLGSINLSLRNRINIIANNASREVANEAIDLTSKSKLLGESILKAQSEVTKLFKSNNLESLPTITKNNKTINYSAKALAKSLTRQLSNQSSVASVLKSCFDNGYDLVIVSKHNDDRLSKFCEPYQGKIYSLSGKNKKYPKFSTVIFNGRYEKGSGLFHGFCRHDIKPYIEATGIDFIYD